MKFPVFCTNVLKRGEFMKEMIWKRRWCFGDREGWKFQIEWLILWGGAYKLWVLSLWHQVKLWLKFNIHEIDVSEGSTRVKWWFIHTESRLGFEAVESGARFTVGSHWERRKSGSWLFWNTAVPIGPLLSLKNILYNIYYLFGCLNVSCGALA